MRWERWSNCIPQNEQVSLLLLSALSSCDDDPPDRDSPWDEALPELPARGIAGIERCGGAPLSDAPSGPASDDGASTVSQYRD
jgi:hypothetical protein